MRIALYSDLHLETHSYQTGTPAWEPPVLDVDLIILAGDIGRHTHGMLWAQKTFGRPNPVTDSGNTGLPEVAYVIGNHEYYDAHLGLLAEMRKPSWKEAGIHLLERNVLERPGVRILGCTLWSGFNLYGNDKVEACMSIAKRSINDYRLINARNGKRLEPRDTLILHNTATRWLDNELAKPFDGKTIVVTHFAPHLKCIAPDRQGSELAPYFVTDLSWLMAKHRIDLWCHGHTHTNTDFIAENGCRVVSNQRGYPRELASGRMGFREDWVIEL